MSERNHSREDLPRLLVISDANAERTAGGELILYRLLCTYPPDRLLIISRATNGFEECERLPEVTYHSLTYRIPRLVSMRFNPFWPVLMARIVTRRTPEALSLAESFRPEAVLSVTHGYLWFVADELARQLHIPFHLILYDDWPYCQTLNWAAWIRPFAVRACEWTERRVFDRAARLYAVSPGMAERYRTQYGVDCEVLLPSRGEDSPTPAVRVRGGTANTFVVAFAGMLHHGWTRQALIALAGEMAKLNGRVDLYAPYTDEQLAQWGLTGQHIRRVGFFPAHEMGDRVAASAQALFLPASFNPAERRDVSTLFPSKLADYTGIGLPLVVWGPTYSSAARWAAENPDAAELVTDPDPTALAAPLARLASDDAYARRLAGGAVRAGLRDFDPTAIRAKFFANLQRPSDGSV
jgi:hypothetical protein